jgi:hypothetical protein
MFREITQGDIDAVDTLLRARANAKGMVRFRDIRIAVGRDLAQSQYRPLLGQIYEEIRLRQGRPDLTAIIINDDNQPPFFSDGGPTNSVPFDPKKHMRRWIDEVNRVHAERW